MEQLILITLSPDELRALIREEIGQAITPPTRDAEDPVWFTRKALYARWNVSKRIVQEMEAGRPIEEVLEEVFSQSPLPNRLKTPKQQWLRGKLGATAQVRIVEEYTPYRCRIVCAA